MEHSLRDVRLNGEMALFGNLKYDLKYAFTYASQNFALRSESSRVLRHYGTLFEGVLASAFIFGSNLASISRGPQIRRIR